MIKEIEKSILGSILINNKALKKCMLFLEPNDFTDSHNKLIYQVMIENSFNNISNDYLTVMSGLKKYSNVDYMNYLIELSDLLPTSENVDSYIKQLKEYTNITRLKQAFKVIDSKEHIETVEAVQMIEDTIEGLSYIDNTETIMIHNNIEDYLNAIADGKDTEKEIPTLYNLLDKKLKIRNGNFIVIGARPAIGKSAFALNMVKHFAMQKKKILFISLEMTREEILNRLISMISKIEVSKIIDKRLSSEEQLRLYETKKHLQSYHINIFDRGSLNIENLVNLCAKLKTNGKLDMLVVDYIGLLGSGVFKDSRVNQIGHISRKLKQIAMDLKIPVIALAQLNRNVVDKNNGKSRKPVLADLRDSGSIEQDANSVLFLHQEQDTELENRFLTLIISKNRAGETGSINYVFKTKTMQFVESEFHNGEWRELEPLKVNNIFD